MVGKFGNFDKIKCDSLHKYYKLHPTTRGIDFFGANYIYWKLEVKKCHKFIFNIEMLFCQTC